MSFCPLCPGYGVSLGTLGTLEHFRCRDCGWTYSEAAQSDDGLHFSEDDYDSRNYYPDSDDIPAEPNDGEGYFDGRDDCDDDGRFDTDAAADEDAAGVPEEGY